MIVRLTRQSSSMDFHALPRGPGDKGPDAFLFILQHILPLPSPPWRGRPPQWAALFVWLSRAETSDAPSFILIPLLGILAAGLLTRRTRTFPYFIHGSTILVTHRCPRCWTFCFLLHYRFKSGHTFSVFSPSGGQSDSYSVTKLHN